MADGYHRKAIVCTISKNEFVELCPADFPFTEAVVLQGSENLKLCENNGKNFVLACKTSTSFTKSGIYRKDLLLNACVNDTDLADFKKSLSKNQFKDLPCNGDDLVLVVPEDLFLHQEFNFGQIAWVKKSRAIPLQRIFVGTTTEESYAWAERCLVPFLLRFSEDGPILVREKDIFPYDAKKESAVHQTLFILQCEPVQQGIITPGTSIVISRMENKTFNEQKEETEDLNVNQSDIFTSFLISDFTHPVREFWSRDSLANLSQEGIGCKPIFKLKVEIILHPNVININSSTGTVVADDVNRLYVSMATLLSMSLFNGSWIKVWIPQSNRSEECCHRDTEEGLAVQKYDELSADHKRGSAVNILVDQASAEDCCENLDQGSSSAKPAFHIVQLFAIDEGHSTESAGLDGKGTKLHSTEIAYRPDTESQDHLAFLSPLLYFNLFGSASFSSSEPRFLCMCPVDSDMKSLWIQESAQDKDSRTSPEPTHPPLASEVQIALVVSPVSKALDLFDKALTRHFKVPRLLTTNDVFFVEYDWKEDIDNRSTYSEERKMRNFGVYFKVTKLVCGTFDAVSALVDVQHTSLYQRGVIHSYVPAVMEAVSCHLLNKASGVNSGRFGDILSPPGLGGYVQRLLDLMKPYLNKRGNGTLPPTGILLTGPPGAGKRTVVMATGRCLCLHMLEVNCYDLIGESIAAIETRVRNVFQKAIASSPCILLLRNINALGKDREGNEDEPRIALTVLDSISKLQLDSQWPVVVTATSSCPRDIAADLFSCFLHEVCMEAPSEEERCSILSGLAEVTTVASDVPLRQLAKRTAGMVASDLAALFSHASRVSIRRVLDSCAEMGVCSKEVFTSVKGANQSGFPWQLEKEIAQAGVSILWEDLERALEILQAAQSDALGAPKIPSVKWEDVGGLADVKAEILDTVQLPLQHPELFAAGLRRSGVLLYGPPGTGKTLLAKAVATECSLNFLSVKGPELINMYVGQSEQNVREVFSRAQSARPCVIFFDELDSLAPNRGRSGDSGGVMDRVVSQLLAELDGLHKACDVFVIGATNRPDLLDPALLRPGRFDKMLYLGISEDPNAQLQILRALTRKFDLSPQFRLDEFVTQCPSNLTGADFYALCSDAMLHSVKRRIHSLEAGEESNEAVVTEEDFKAALDKLVPSVSSQELKRYKLLQEQFALAANTTNRQR